MIDPYEHVPRPEDPRRNRAHPSQDDDESRASRLVARTDWLEARRLYWSGETAFTDGDDQEETSDGSSTNSAPRDVIPGIRSIRHCLNDRLEGKRSAVYSYRLNYPDRYPSRTGSLRALSGYLDPDIGLELIDRQKISQTARALSAWDRHWQHVSRLLPQPERQRARRRARLRRTAALVEVASDEDHLSSSRSLALEEYCLYVGSDASRPSRRLSPMLLREALGQRNRSSLDGRQVASLAASRRNVDMGADQSRPLGKVGRALREWPIDLLATCTTDDSVTSWLLRKTQTGDADFLNEPLVVNAVDEYTASVGTGGLQEALSALGGLASIVEQFREEPRRRAGLFLQVLEQGTQVDPLTSEYRSKTRLEELAPLLGQAVDDGWKRGPFEQSGLLNHGQVESLWEFFFGARMPEDLWHDIRGRIEEAADLQGEVDDLSSVADVIYEVIPARSQCAHWSELGVLIGRSVARTNDPVDVANGVHHWLLACRRLIPPGNPHSGNSESLRIAVSMLGLSLVFTRWSPDQLRHLYRNLVESPDAFVPGTEDISIPSEAAIWHSEQTAPVSMRRLPPIALAPVRFTLTQRDCRLIRGHSILAKRLSELLDRKVVRLGVAARWVGTLTRVKKEYGHLPYLNTDWVDLVALRHAELARRLPEWLERLLERPPDDRFVNDTFVLELTGLVEALGAFCLPTRHEVGNESERQEFLFNAIGPNAVLTRRVRRGIRQGLRTRDSSLELSNLYWALIVAFLRNRKSDALFRDGGLSEALLTQCLSVDRTSSIADPLFRFSDGDSHFFSAALGLRLYGGDSTPTRDAEAIADLMEEAYHRHRSNPERLRKLARYIDEDSDLRETLRAAHREADLAPTGCLRILERLELVDRIRPAASVEQLLDPWKHQGRESRYKLPEWLHEWEDDLGRIRSLREVYDADNDLPNTLTDIVDRPQKLEKERKHLERKAQQGKLDNDARPRLERLRRYTEQPEDIRAWVRQDLAAEVPTHLAIAQIEALKATLDRQLDDYWKQVLGESPPEQSSGWETALSLYWELKDGGENFSVLRRLLRHRLEGATSNWKMSVRANQEYLSELRKADIEVRHWLERHETKLLYGRHRLTAYTASNPLEIFQMGKRFGTCLTPGKSHDYAVVANAAEVNKRVLYVRDRDGSVVGRKLVLMAPDGRLWGFRSYGKGRSGKRGQLVKLSLELLSLQIAQHCGASLGHEESANRLESEYDEGDLSLFCEGYLEYPEPFDWWIRELQHGRTVEEILTEFPKGTGSDGGITADARFVLWLERSEPELVSGAREQWSPNWDQLKDLERSDRQAVKAVCGGQTRIVQRRQS